MQEMHSVISWNTFLLHFQARPLNIAFVFRSGDDRMADYYSVLARAVVNLETGEHGAREELYERARSIIVAELRKQNPRISALAITREQAALEAAIRRLETELQPPSRDSDRKSGHQKRSDAEADSLSAMPKALAAMLFGTAYLAAIIAFSGVVYLRGLALVYADIIQYPILLGAMVGLGCLLVPLSRTVFRRLRVYSRSAVPAR
jgi:hypothetical protein